jgi:hypothetical protein
VTAAYKITPNTVKGDRCAFPRETYEEVVRLAVPSKKTPCEVQVYAINYYIGKTKLLSDCKTGAVTGDACKCVVSN